MKFVTGLLIPLFAIVFFAMTPQVTNASVIGVDLTSGTWKVTGIDIAGNRWDGSTLVFKTQVLQGQEFTLSGHFNWVGSGGQFGRENFTGSLLSNRTLQLSGFEIVPPASGGIVIANYSGLLADSGTDIINGSWSGGAVIPSNSWSATLAPVPFNITFNPSIQGKLESQLIFSSLVSPEMKAQKDLKEHYRNKSDELENIGDTIDTTIPIDPTEQDGPIIRVLNGILTVMKGAAGTVEEYLAIGGKTSIKGGEGIFDKLAKDPPDPNFLEIAERSGEQLDPQFALTFGEEFALVDLAFLDLGIGLESYDLLLPTLERMQGAILANDFSAFNLQKDRAIELLTEGEEALLRASANFASLSNIFNDDHASLIASDLSKISLGITHSSILASQPVPVPSTVLLFTTGIFLLFVFLRSKKDQLCQLQK